MSSNKPILNNCTQSDTDNDSDTQDELYWNHEQFNDERPPPPRENDGMIRPRSNCENVNDEESSEPEEEELDYWRHIDAELQLAIDRNDINLYPPVSSPEPEQEMEAQEMEEPNRCRGQECRIRFCDNIDCPRALRAEGPSYNYPIQEDVFESESD
jgi:hypothetical protein